MKVSDNKQLETYLLERGVPKRYVKDTKTEDYSLPYGAIAAKANVGGLYIFGSVGTGKTQLAIDVMSDVAQKKKIEITITGGYDANMQVKKEKETALDPDLFVFLNVPRFLTRIRKTFDEKGNSLEDTLQRLNRYEYLILDDFGAEKVTDWVAETLYLIVTERYEEEKKIIFTSNRSLKQIAETIDDRIASRIMEMCAVVELVGMDRRSIKK